MKKWCKYRIVYEENDDGSYYFYCRLGSHILNIKTLISFYCPLFLERL